MRIFYMTVLGLFLVAVLVFAMQNHHSATLSILRMELSAPLSIIIVLSYVLGMISGWSIFRFLRKSLAEVRDKDTKK